MIWRGGLAILLALGLAAPALMWLAAAFLIRFIRDLGLGATLYLAVFLIVGVLVS